MTMSSTQKTLDVLPVELVEYVISLLERPDIFSLRLVSPTVAAKSEQCISKRFFTVKTLKLNLTQLSKFVHLTQANRMGRFLQRLTLVGVIVAHADIDIEPLCDKYLSQAFSNLRLNSPSRGLQSLGLSIEGQDDNGSRKICEQMKDWNRIWNLAAHMFQIVSAGLAESALPLEELDIFGRGYRRCLDCDSIAPILYGYDLSACFSNLKRLSLGLSNCRRADSKDFASGQKRALDIVRLIQSFSQLEALDLRWHRLSYHSEPADVEELRFLDHLLQWERLAQLQECQLRGIFTSETTLLALVRKMTHLQSLRLEHVCVKGGSFKPVLDHLVGCFPRLQRLELNSLVERQPGSRQGVLCFDAPGELPDADPDNPILDLTVTRQDPRRSIEYRYVRFQRYVQPRKEGFYWQKEWGFGPPKEEGRGLGRKIRWYFTF